MDVSERRRHGDVFPLPPHVVSNLAMTENISQSQRAYWISDSLNKLALHGSCNSLSRSILSSQLPLTSAQDSVASRIVEALRLHGDCPPDLTPEVALSKLRGGKPAYDGVPNNLDSYDPRKLKILSKGTVPKHILSFLPSEAAALVRNFRHSIIRPESVELGSFSPYWDPALRFNRSMRMDFIVKLFHAGLMTFRPTAASFVGAFCVKKKDPRFQRLVIDCRGTNMLHCDPPTTRLGSSRCYSDLDLGRSSSSDKVCGREADVDDCFYRFGLPELSHYFAINHPLQAQEWRAAGLEVGRIFNPETTTTFKPSDEQLLFPCFQVVPMGWTWALWLCNEAVLSIARSLSPWNDGILRERKPTPQLDNCRTIVGVYVDNITVIGSSAEDVQTRCDALQKSFDRAGIPITWSQDAPVRQLESVGIVLDFEGGRVINKPRRVWSFHLATIALLRRRKLNADILQIWAGHYTSLMGIASHGLSALFDTYRFIETAKNGRKTVWSSVRREMKHCAALVWMAIRPLVAPTMNLVEVGDASSSGYAMMASEPPVGLIKQASVIHERWRFCPMPAELKDLVGKGDSDGFVQVLGKMLQADDVVVGQTGKDYFGPAGLNTKYAQFVFDAVQEGSLLATSAIKSQLRAKRSSRADIEIPALVQPLDDFFSEPKNFHLLWCRRWRNLDEHITIKEARVALSSLRRSSRVAGVHGYRKLTLSDNLPCILAFSKGRSSNFKMNLVCQTASAIQFATQIGWHLRHVETKRNVADKDSRRFEPKRRLGRRQPFHLWEFTDGGLSREASAPSKPFEPKRVTVDQVLPGRTLGRYFLEIFSGTGNLTREVVRQGLPALEPLDIVLGPFADLRRKSTQEFILTIIKQGLIGFVHLGTPCTIWSRARHGVKETHANRIKEEIGLELALFTAVVVKHCIRYGVAYAVENPRSSKLFAFRPLVEAFCSGPHYFIDFDMCKYGEKYQKSTRLVTSVPWLKPLSQRCDHHGHEVWLKGKVKVQSPEKGAVYVNRTALAGAYPLDPVVPQIRATHQGAV